MARKWFLGSSAECIQLPMHLVFVELLWIEGEGEWYGASWIVLRSLFAFGFFGGMNVLGLFGKSAAEVEEYS